MMSPISSASSLLSALALASLAAQSQATIVNMNEVCLSALSSFLYGHLGVCGAPPDLIIPRSNSYAPWTTKPQCVESDIGDKERYCVFSKNDFADGRGIVLITTEALAADIASKPAFTNPQTIAGFNDLINPPWGPPAYEIKALPGRGFGGIANRTIFRGERIMLETPSFVYNRNLYTGLEDKNRIPLAWNGAYTLPAHTRDELLALHKHHGGDEIDDLMRTNAFGAFYGEDMYLHNNVLPRIARFNHDCRPNAHYYFDADTMTQYVHAVRTINVGEEIHINYSDSEFTFEERQHAIYLSWGFECQCSLCRQPPTHVAASDTRLEQIRVLKEKLNDWSYPQPNRAELALNLINLYEKERLYVPLAAAYESAAYAFAIDGDEARASRYAAHAVEAMTIMYGADHPLTMDLEVMMLDPKEHRTWLYKVPGQEEKEREARAKKNKTEEKEKEKDGWNFF